MGFRDGAARGADPAGARALRAAPDAQAQGWTVETVARTSAEAIATLNETKKKQRDDTCAPEPLVGEWQLVRRGMKQNARDYQRQIARTPDLPGKMTVEYRVTNPLTDETALFDGCAYWSPRRELLEAKYGYGDLLAAWERYDFPFNAEAQVIRELKKQQAAAGTTQPVDWHSSHQRAVGFFSELVERAESPNFSVRLSPAR